MCPASRARTCRLSGFFSTVVSLARRALSLHERARCHFRPDRSFRRWRQCTELVETRWKRWWRAGPAGALVCRAPLACAPGAGEANAADAALMEEREDRPSRMGRYQTRPTMTPTRRCGGAASWPRGGEARGRRAAPAAAGSARVGPAGERRARLRETKYSLSCFDSFVDSSGRAAAGTTRYEKRHQGPGEGAARCKQ